MLFGIEAKTATQQQGRTWQASLLLSMDSGPPDGSVFGTAQHVSFAASAAAPLQSLLSYTYDELLDARYGTRRANALPSMTA